MQGISTNRDCTAIADCLAAAGIEFVARYYCADQFSEKRLKEEALALSKAGLWIAVFYEDDPRQITYFTGSRGHQDGVLAYHIGRNLGQPAGSVIYFTADNDFTAAQISGPIADYFRGVQQGFTDAARAIDPAADSVYKIGVYGSGLCCQWLNTHLSFVEFAWLSESTSWRGTSTYADWDVTRRMTCAGCRGRQTGTTRATSANRSSSVSSSLAKGKRSTIPVDCDRETIRVGGNPGKREIVAGRKAIASGIWPVFGKARER
jgi:hypothetical protein